MSVFLTNPPSFTCSREEWRRYCRHLAIDRAAAMVLIKAREEIAGLRVQINRGFRLA